MGRPKKEFSMKFRRDFIGEHVKVSSADYKNPAFWSREIKMTAKLYEKFDSVKFLKNLRLGFKLNSLAWLISGDGKREIERQWAEFNYVPPKIDEEVVLSDVRIGEDSKAKKKKNQTLMDFLNS